MRLSRRWLKLMRDMRRSRWQFLAVAIVIALGVAIFIAAYGSYQNLRSSYDRTYRELSMGDLWFQIEDAPLAVTEDIRAIDGVKAAEGRLTIEFPIVLPGESHRILARAITLPEGEDGAPRRAQVSDVKVTGGEYPSASGQVLLEQSFADFNHVRTGDTVTAVLPGGSEKRLLVSGTATSPEYLWVARSERDLFTPPSTFGIIYPPYSTVSTLFGLNGRVNNIAVVLEERADASRAQREISSVLAPYGPVKVTDRDHLISNRLLKLDLDGFQSLALVFPLLFLAVSTLAIYTLLNRLVQNQRGQVGVMRAMGFSRAQVLRHYMGYGLVIGAVAAVVGDILGFGLSVLMTMAYAEFLNVPFISVSAQPGVLAIGFAAGFAASLAAAAVPAWTSAGLRPAEAMRPPLPSSGRRTILETLIPPLARMPSAVKLPLRNVFRSPRRTVYTAFGMAAGVSLVLVAASFLDSYDRAITDQFDRIQNYDARLNFQSTFPVSLADEAQKTEGVTDTEAIAEVPVLLSAGIRTHATLLQGLPPEGGLLRVYASSGNQVQPADGLLITGALARLLGVSSGDSIHVQSLGGIAGSSDLRVDGIVQQPLGDVVFSSLSTAQSLLGAKGAGTALLVSFQGQADPVLENLYELQGVTSVDLTRDLKDYVYQLSDLFFVFVFIMLGFGVALGFAIIFNTITINVLERQRELATMRTFGMATGRLAVMLTVENVLMGLAGVAVGLPVGFGLAQYFASLYNNELFDMPTVIYARTYAIAAAGAVLVLLLAEFPAIRFVRRLDLPAVVREMSA